jgi:hypothetical protein
MDDVKQKIPPVHCLCGAILFGQMDVSGGGEIQTKCGKCGKKVKVNIRFFPKVNVEFVTDKTSHENTR